MRSCVSCERFLVLLTFINELLRLSLTILWLIMRDCINYLSIASASKMVITMELVMERNVWSLSSSALYSRVKMSNLDDHTMRWNLRDSSAKVARKIASSLTTTKFTHSDNFLIWGHRILCEWLFHFHYYKIYHLLMPNIKRPMSIIHACVSVVPDSPLEESAWHFFFFFLVTN